MIVDNLYPTLNTFEDVEITDILTNLNITDSNTDPATSYYMGYMDSDNIKIINWKEMYVEFNQTEPLQSKVIFKTKNQGFIPWAYILSNSSRMQRNAYNSNNGKWEGTFNFINHVKMYKATNYGNCYFNFTSYKLEGIDGKEWQVSYQPSFSTSVKLNIKEVYDFYNNITEIQVNVGNNETVTVKRSDFENGYKAVINGYTIILSGYSMESTSAYYPQNRTFNIMPLAKIKAGESFNLTNSFVSFTPPSVIITIPHNNLSGKDDVKINTSYYKNYGGIENILPDVEIPYEFFDYIKRNGYLPEYECNGLFARYGGSASEGYVINLDTTVHLDDPWHAWCMINKWQISGYSYSTTYTTDHLVSTFNTNDEPLNEKITGNYSSIVGRLRLWQMYDVDITVNDFDVDKDLPDEPDDPDLPDIPDDPDLPDAEGTDIENQPNRTVSAPTNFITYYVVNDSIIQKLGKLLWGEMLDKDSNIWQNFATEVQYDTGSYNIQSIFNFFVSLRIFPFSVGTLPICTGSGTDIKIGSGKAPIPMQEDVRRLTSIVGNIHVGSVVVKPPELYGDFRDIYNTTVTVYLPYCGTLSLNPAEVIGNTLDCFYSVDFSTGQCIAFVSVINDGKKYNVGMLSGNIGALLPMTATNAGQVLAQRSIDTSQGTIFGNNSITSAISSIFGAINDPSKILNLPFNAINRVEQGNIQNVQQKIMRSAIDAPMLSGGNGIASFLMPATAYVQVRRGHYYSPIETGMPHSQGYTSAIKGKLNTFKKSGNLSYISCNNVDVSGLKCIDAEKQIIKQMLESGVYV